MAQNFGESFRCVEHHEGILSWTDLASVMRNSQLSGASSHGLVGPAPVEDFITICLVRNPIERLLSAWRFETVKQKVWEGPFSSYLEEKTDLRNFQAQRFDQDVFESLSGVSSKKVEGAFFSTLKHRRTALGVVERYDESMVLFELFLLRYGVKVDFSYSRKRNVQDVPLNPDVDVPGEFVDLDLDLYRFANDLLDLEISLTPDFNRKLRDFRKRCSLKTGAAPVGLHPLCEQRNWIVIGGES